MNSVYVIDALRTPIGKYGGALSQERPDDLAALTIVKIVERNFIHASEIDDVIFGAANQAGEDNRNVARMALLLAGLPVTVPGVTVNRLCASGMEAIMQAAKSIAAGMGDVFLAGGVESMSRAPFVIPKSEKPFERKTELFDTTMGWRFINKKLAAMHYPFSMGETAENVAEKFHISRHEQDEFALHSQQKYFAAAEKNKFSSELISVPVKKQGGVVAEVDKDEHPRQTSMQQLSALQPAFKKDGTVTAGNSSGINDGASCLLLASEAAMKKNNWKPMAKIISMAAAGVEPALMGMGPVPATQKVLQRAGLSTADIGLVELNEAFASQSIACIRELKLKDEIVNVNGGAIAIGHPLGCSGARISATLLHEMRKRNTAYGLATMCVGVGQGTALIFELMN